jgi:hypothetical protein
MPKHAWAAQPQQQQAIAEYEACACCLLQRRKVILDPEHSDTELFHSLTSYGMRLMNALWELLQTQCFYKTARFLGSLGN